MPALQSPHLVIPFSSCSGDAWRPTMKALPANSLENLDKLLLGMKLVETDTGNAHSLSTAHERVLAKAAGLTEGNAIVDGLIPRAAWEAAKGLDTAAMTQKAWGFITPCHWAMGREHAVMTDPAALAMTPDESRSLLAAMQPYFETEGITLNYLTPERWLAEGEVFRSLPTASLDRVLGRNVDMWLPNSRPIKLLQNEMQMLLYTHPLNDERSAKRLRSINSFWLSGTGALTQALPDSQVSQSSQAELIVPRTLAQAAFNDDWIAYAQAWEQLNAKEIAQLIARQKNGDAVRLTLCGESNAQTFETVPKSLFSRISSIFSPKPSLILLEQL